MTRVRRKMAFSTLLTIAGLLAACSGAAASPTAAPTATSAAPAATSAGGDTGAHASATAASDALHLNLVADGTQASYRVREQLAQLSFPSDAVGTTSAVTGTLVVNPDGTIIDEQS